MSREKWTLQRWTSRALIFLRNRLWARQGDGAAGEGGAAEQRQAGRTQAGTGNTGASRDTSAQRAPLTADQWHATQAHNTLKRHATHSKAGSSRLQQAGPSRHGALPAICHLGDGQASQVFGGLILTAGHTCRPPPARRQIMFFAPLTRLKGYLAQI